MRYPKLKIMPNAEIAYQNNFTEEFYRACLNGDFESALNFLKMGVNLNFRFENGKNLLHVACAKNFYGLVQLLIKFGCNEFLKDNSGRTALHYACVNNSVSIVRYLVEKNIFTDKTDNSVIIRDFLNCQDNDGKTVFHILTEKNYVEALSIIFSLAHGLSNLNIVDLNNKTALMISYEKKHHDAFEILFKNSSVVSKEILKDICVKGHLKFANILLSTFDSTSQSKQVEWRQLDENGNTILYSAIKCSNNIDLVEKLLKIGLKINLKDKFDFLEHIFNFKENNSKETNTYLYYLECFILLLKNFCFYDFKNDISDQDFSFSDISIDIKHIKSIRTKLRCNRFLAMVLINFFHKISLNFQIKPNMFSLFKQRFVYMFALSVYSKQLDIKEIYFKEWLKQIEANKKLENLEQSFAEIYKESISSPWTLQMIARIQVKKSFHQNLDHIINNTNIGKKLPDICIRYLRFDFI